jgi:hypothetical protein
VKASSAVALWGLAFALLAFGVGVVALGVWAVRGLLAL